VAEFTDFALDNEFNVENKPTLIGHKYKGRGVLEARGEKWEFDIEGKSDKLRTNSGWGQLALSTPAGSPGR
jgi:hypothetical protein